MKRIALAALCIIPSACSAPASHEPLAKRVCGMTLEDPRRWIKSQEAYADLNPNKPGLDVASRRIAASDCVRGNIYDLAASGLSESQVVHAARIQCDDLETAFVNYGYESEVKTHALMNLTLDSDTWTAQVKRELDDVGAAAFVEARAGQCWSHRVYLPVAYAKGT